MDTKKFYVLIFHSSSADDVFKKDDGFENLVKRFGFGYIEKKINTIEEMIYQLLDFNETKPESKIAHLVIRAHGHETGMHIGTDNLDIIVQDRLYHNFNTFIELFSKLSTNLASIFLHSCSVGKDVSYSDSFARYLSKKINIPIFASNEIIHTYDLIVDNITSGMPLSFPFCYRVSSDRITKNYEILLFKNGEIIKDDEYRKQIASIFE